MSAVTQPAPINEDKMNAVFGQSCRRFWRRLEFFSGLHRPETRTLQSLAASGPATPAELAQHTNTNERYVREWLINQAAGGYVEYDTESGRYSLTPEQAVALTEELSPFYVGGGFFVIKAMTHAVSRIEDYFRNGGGMLWGEHDPDLFIGTERFFRPGYAAHLVATWIPALTGIEEKLKAGGKVADVGCGHGSSTIIMAHAYPNSTSGDLITTPKSPLDCTPASQGRGSFSDRVHFEVANAQNIPDNKYDMIAFFDCLHDMGDPVGACKRAAEVLAPDGSALIVEPMAGNTVEENFNIIGRTFAGASTLCCTANSMALGGPALGAVAPESAIREVVLAGGFTEFRRATETPFNRIFEARK